MNEHQVNFGTLHPDGTVSDTRQIPRAAMLACPRFIIVPEHYRADDTCRCNDPTHQEMVDWGHIWDEVAEVWS